MLREINWAQSSEDIRKAAARVMHGEAICLLSIHQAFKSSKIDKVLLL